MPAEPRPLLPSLRLDELLDELQVRLQAVLSTRDRVYALLEAVVAVGSNLDLERLLRTVVETAVSLVDARYGAMGVLSEGGQLGEFIPVGLSPQEVAAVDHWPQGKGLLGLLITEAKPLLIDDIAAHPASAGFPAGHPPMRSFLGVPIRVRGEVYGNLYLTDKQGGAGRFDSDDQAVVVALAAAAGVAIENARLYGEARRQQRWVSATAEVTKQLLSGAEPDEALTIISELALEMTGADLVVVLLPTGDADDTALRVEHAAGHEAEEVLGLPLAAGDSLFGTVLTAGERLTITDVSSDDRIDTAARERLRLGPAVAVPLGAPGQVRGVLVAGRSGGGLPLSAQAAETLATFAAQAAIGLQLAEHRRQAERMAVFEDRDRIARDLHDLVIQRLYATGMSLQGAMPLVVEPDVGERIGRAVDALDETIREIRSAIFALQTRPPGAPASLRARILSVTQEMAGALGYAPSLRLDGVLDSAVPQHIADDLLSALREALSNVARHARARRVDVTVRVDDQLVLTVRDDGVGIRPGGRRSGLRNLEHRAAALGGRLVAAPAKGGGTELLWQVPLAGPDAPDAG